MDAASQGCVQSVPGVRVRRSGTVVYRATTGGLNRLRVVRVILGPLLRGNKMPDAPRCSVDIAECHDGGSPATWRATNRDALFACDRHKGYFDERADEFGVKWERLAASSGLIEDKAET